MWTSSDASGTRSNQQTQAESGKQATTGKHPTLPKDWICGFLLLGLLLGLIGSLLVAWQYHIDTDPRLIGLHFLGLNGGYVVAGAVTRGLLRRSSIRAMAVLASCLAVFSLVALAFAAPPVPVWTRLLGLWFLGMSAGGLASSLLHAFSSYYTRAPAQAINLTGTLFGSGCALATLAMATTYFAGSVQLEVGLLAVVPVVFMFVFWTTSFGPARRPFHASAEEQKNRDALRHSRSVAAVLFSVLLFVQFGNEWVLAGWLPIFLIHRLGANPAGAIFTLAVHFAALTASRLAVRELLPLVRHRRLLNIGILLAIAGFALLSFSPSMAGACVAVILIGMGYAPIYPVLAETLDRRFSFHPGFYQGLFSIAITGAMSLPWLVGYVDNMLGTEYIMLLPALGSLVVLVLALLIRLEARLMGGNSDSSGSSMTLADR